jgi:O-antigen/teichoic acid export membrane protein
LSIYFFAWGITQGRIALLQGLRKVKVYATYQVVQVIILSATSVLLYLQYGFQAIWVVILAGALVPIVLVWYFTKEETIKWQWNFLHVLQTYQSNRAMIHLGLLLSVNALIGQLCFLGIRSFLQHQDDFALVGYYEVSQALLVKYMGMLFVAMSYDFYPKLTSIIKEPNQATKLIEHQIEIAMYLLAPAIAVFYLIGEYLVPLLYSKEFLPALEILQFGWLVLFLKAFTFPIGFYALAKGDKKTFFWQELLGDLGNLLGS